MSTKWPALLRLMFDKRWGVWRSANVCKQKTQRGLRQLRVSLTPLLFLRRANWMLAPSRVARERLLAQSLRAGPIRLRRDLELPPPALVLSTRAYR
jgi:hypothetical protein